MKIFTAEAQRTRRKHLTSMGGVVIQWPVLAILSILLTTACNREIPPPPGKAIERSKLPANTINIDCGDSVITILCPDEPDKQVSYDDLPAMCVYMNELLDDSSRVTAIVNQADKRREIYSVIDALVPVVGARKGSLFASFASGHDDGHDHVEVIVWYGSWVSAGGHRK